MGTSLRGTNTPPLPVATYIAEGGVYEDVALGRVLRGPSEVASFVGLAIPLVVAISTASNRRSTALHHVVKRRSP